MKRGFFLLALLIGLVISGLYSQPSGAASQSGNSERRIALIIGNNT